MQEGGGAVPSECRKGVGLCLCDSCRAATRSERRKMTVVEQPQGVSPVREWGCACLTQLYIYRGASRSEHRKRVGLCLFDTAIEEPQGVSTGRGLGCACLTQL